MDVTKITQAYTRNPSHNVTCHMNIEYKINYTTYNTAYW
jgi:hypothetical protein